MTARPLISVFDYSQANTLSKEKLALPGVFKAPIRQDIVHFVHSNIAKNRRQPRGVNPDAGMKHSAESWGTGRAVARIPRVSGSGTHRSGQGAFGNMCRKGRMFAPLKTWRRWYRKVNLKQKRHAVASALAASAIAALVQARGHRIHNIPELPLVVDNKFESIDKTKDAVNALKALGAYADIKKVIDSKTLRAGLGKIRNRRYQLRKGPLVVYGTEHASISKALRNIPGVDTVHVTRLNLLQLAPGAQLGRFIIWTASAFGQLNEIFGTYRYAGQEKNGYQLQRHLLGNADLARIINSNEIQSVIKNAECQHHWPVQKQNPLHNTRALDKLNPYAKIQRKQRREANESGKKLREQAKKNNQGASKRLSKEQKSAKKQHKKKSTKWLESFKSSIKKANDVAIKDEYEFRKDI